MRSVIFEPDELAIQLVAIAAAVALSQDTVQTLCAYYCFVSPFSSVHISFATEFKRLEPILCFIEGPCQCCLLTSLKFGSFENLSFTKLPFVGTSKMIFIGVSFECLKITDCSYYLANLQFVC